MSDGGYAAATTSVAMRRSTRDVVDAVGPDTETFLQGQLSQDIAALAIGASAPSLLLAPQGKVDALLRVTRMADDHFLLDVDAGWADAVVTRLQRFLLRTRCELTARSWDSLSLRGPAAAEVTVTGAEVDTDAGWPTIAGRDLLGPTLNLEVGAPAPAELSDEAWTALRIEAGRPAMGSELDEDTIPAAAGIVNESVSFTKGCYTGQELVARIDSRGNKVPRRLCALAPATDSTPQPGAELSRDGKVVGLVTSSAFSPGHGGVVCLAYVARSVDEQETVTVGNAAHVVMGIPFPSATV